MIDVDCCGSSYHVISKLNFHKASTLIIYRGNPLVDSLQKTKIMMNTIAGPKLDDEVELVGGGASGVMFRLRRFCCGSRIRAWVSFSLVFFVVIGITVAVSIILTRRKFVYWQLIYSYALNTNGSDKLMNCRDG